MRLHFDRTLVERLLKHTLEAPNHLPSYGERKPIKAALWLVGDDGIYLMSNGGPGCFVEGTTKNVICYARECNPTQMDFDDWWSAKQASFGGDDGVEPLDAAELRDVLADYPQGAPLQLEVSKQQIGIIGYGPPPKGATPEPNMTLEEAQEIKPFQLKPSFVQRYCGPGSPKWHIVGIGEAGQLGRWVLLSCGHWRELRDYDVQPALGRKRPRRAGCGCCRLGYVPNPADLVRAQELACSFGDNAPIPEIGNKPLVGAELVSPVPPAPGRQA